MKKKLLTIGILSTLTGLANAQTSKPNIVTFVGNGANVTILANTLVYSGGGLQTAGTGSISNSGNVMIVGSTNDVFSTVNTDASAKTDGGNFILNSTNPTTYGQLYINGLSQANITGIVDKQYYATSDEGTYQQMGLPFYNLSVSSLGSALGMSFSSTRRSTNEILTWNNTKPRSDMFSNSSTSATSNPTAYYQVGTGSSTWKPSALHTIKGIPYNDVDTYSTTGITLQNAGAGDDFASGFGLNIYGEKYSTYLQDAFDFSTGQWVNNYGKNIYQFGNPFFTNLDLSLIGYAESAATGDGNNITNIQGIRYGVSGVYTDSNGATMSTGVSYVTFTSGKVPTGDIDKVVLKPLQPFVIKLSNNTSDQTLKFGNLRRFATTARSESVSYSVTAAKSGQTSNVKQLGVIALDKNGAELGRTYYVVYNDAITGRTSTPTTQVSNSDTAVIGSYEESVNGGMDNNAASDYWLYINEANDTDFKGKEVPMYTYSSKIAKLKFEILENAKAIPEGQTDVDGDSFYLTSNGTTTQVANGETIDANGSDQGSKFGLYYGKPSATLATSETSSKNATQIVYGLEDKNYKVIFGTDWKKANISIYDMSGRLVSNQKNIDTTSPYTLTLNSTTKSSYIVKVVSDKGEIVTKKIIK